MFRLFDEWLRQQGLGERAVEAWATAVDVGVVMLLAVIANFVTKRIIVRGAVKIAANTKTNWDDFLIRRKALQRLSHLAPALVIFHFASAVFSAYPQWTPVVQQVCFIYMVVVAAWSASGALNAFDDIARTTATGQALPTKSFVQVAQIVLFSVTAIAVLSLILGRSPLLLLSGLGAMTAVLMLVFKDTILGLVAGVQLSANRMVSRGDWIEMPKYGADGDVMEVALTTVKVRNWDKTITTIPTYALISESFKNWRGMSESGGRRIKRAINIDLGSIRFCDEEMLARFRRIDHVAEYLDAKQLEIGAWNAERGVDQSNPINGRQLTNVGTFRAYIAAYLRHHPQVNTDMTFLVRQLPPGPQGLPIEIYVFSRDIRWAAYEDIQADIFDHIIAVAPQFDLRLYQNPTGADVSGALATLAHQ